MVLLNSKKCCLCSLDVPQMLLSAHLAPDHITHPVTQGTQIRRGSPRLDNLIGHTSRASLLARFFWSFNFQKKRQYQVTTGTQYLLLHRLEVQRDHEEGGLRNQRLTRKGRSTDGEKTLEREPTPVLPQPTAVFYSAFPLPPQGPHSKDQSNPGCFCKGRREDSWHFKVKPKIL